MFSPQRRSVRVLFVLGLCAIVTACGDDKVGGLGGFFPISGMVNGLTGTLVLQNGADADLQLTSSGSFAFRSQVRSGNSYAVTVKTQPVNQICTVAKGSGKVNGHSVTDIVVTCTTNQANAFSVGGRVEGATGPLVLVNTVGAAVDTLADVVAGPFTFTTPVQTGINYVVSVRTPPVGQQCTVASGAGVMGAANVTNVVVTCQNGAGPNPSSFTVGGSVTGLAGSGLVLRNNGGDDIAVNQSGQFAFATTLAAGGAYNVTVFKQPRSPVQNCTITNGGGTVSNANVDTVAVTCATLVARFAYVANSGSRSVSMFTVNAATGQLRHRGDVRTGNSPSLVVLSPDGRFVYVTSDDLIDGYRIAADGSLDRFATNSVQGERVLSMVIDAAGKFAYVSYFDRVRVYAVLDDGTLVERQSTAAGSPHLKIDSLGRFLYAAAFANGDPILSYAIAADGTLTPIDGIAQPAGKSFVIDAGATSAYVGGEDSTVAAYSIGSDGALVAKGPPLDLGSRAIELLLDPAGRFVYVTVEANKLIAIELDPATGALGAKLAEGDVGGRPESATVDASGAFVFVTDSTHTRVVTLPFDAENKVFGAANLIEGVSGFTAGLAVTRGTSPVRYVPQFAYGSDARATVFRFAADADSGDLTRIDATPIADVAAANEIITSMEVDSTAGVLYVNGSVQGLGAHIYALHIDSDGALTQFTSRELPSGAERIILDPARKFLLALTQTDLSILSINADGSVGPPNTIPIGMGSANLAIEPTGHFVYVLTNSTTLAPGNVVAFEILSDLTLRRRTAVPLSHLGNVGSIAADPLGRAIYVTNSDAGEVSTFEIQPDGSLQVIGGPIPSGVRSFDLVIEPSGRFVYTAHDPASIQTFGILGSGGLAGDANSPFDPFNKQQLSIDPAGKFLYLPGSGANGFQVLAIGDNGILIPRPPVTVGGTNVRLAFKTLVQ